MRALGAISKLDFKGGGVKSLIGGGVDLNTSQKGGGGSYLLCINNYYNEINLLAIKTPNSLLPPGNSK